MLCIIYTLSTIFSDEGNLHKISCPGPSTDILTTWSCKAASTEILSRRSGAWSFREIFAKWARKNSLPPFPYLGPLAGITFFWLQCDFVLMASEYFLIGIIFFDALANVWGSSMVPAWFQHANAWISRLHCWIQADFCFFYIYIYILSLYIYISLSLSLALIACLIGHQPDSEFCPTCLSLRCVYDNAHATSQCVTEIQNIKDLKNR